MQNSAGVNAIHCLIGSAAVFLPTVATAETPSVSLEPAPVEKVFVPQGFDNNDNTEVIIQGRFPNACMKTGPVGAKIDTQNQVITLKPEVYVYRGEPCAQVVVPFTQRVTFGTLTAGTWKIIVEDMPAINPLPLEVARARSAAPDDFLYAPVEEVVLLPAGISNRQKLVISGNWPQIQGRGCFSLKEIRTHLGADNTLVVQPIAELLPAARCSSGSARKRVFQGSVVLDKPLNSDSLIHVRTLNGESLNKFFEGQ
ncbi:MAG: hypothetical protein RLZZ488_988 [Pseudomonadota bacterium]|jgi:hypothetical protein